MVTDRWRAAHARPATRGADKRGGRIDAIRPPREVVASAKAYGTITESVLESGPVRSSGLRPRNTSSGFSQLVWNV